MPSPSPVHGTLSGTATNLTYTPNAGFQGTDSFTFTVNNGFNTSPAATVTLNVAAGIPTANPQTVSIPFNTATGLTLTGSDPDSPPLASDLRRPYQPVARDALGHGAQPDLHAGYRLPRAGQLHLHRQQRV